MSEAHRTIALTDTPNGTHTQYLVMYQSGAVTCDVHELLERLEVDDSLEPPFKIIGVMLIVNDEEGPVWVEVDGEGAEWNITRAYGDQVLEAVVYKNADRAEVVTDEVYVAGFPEVPTYPQMEDDDED